MKKKCLLLPIVLLSFQWSFSAAFNKHSQLAHDDATTGSLNATSPLHKEVSEILSSPSFSEIDKCFLFGITTLLLEFDKNKGKVAENDFYKFVTCVTGLNRNLPEKAKQDNQAVTKFNELFTYLDKSSHKAKLKLIGWLKERAPMCSATINVVLQETDTHNQIEISYINSKGVEEFKHTLSTKK